MRLLLLLLASLALGLPSNAFVVSGYFWETGIGTFHVAIPGNAPSGISWNDAFVEAMDSWSSVANFQYVMKTESVDPCLGQENGGFGDGITSVGFAPDNCGDEFGSNTLAITLTSGYCIGDCMGDGRVRISDADIVFKADESWDVHSGSRQSGVTEFRRVALHELGHALGLRHSSESPAIMQQFISGVETLQADDMAGITSIYGDAPSALTVSPSLYSVNITVPVKSTLSGPTDNFSLSGKLENTDDKFDNRFIDIFQYTFTRDSLVTLKLNSSNFDGFLYLARISSGQALLDAYTFSDDNSGPGPNAQITATLPAGTYWVGVSTAQENSLGFYDLSVNSATTANTSPVQTYQSAYGPMVQVNPNPVITGRLDLDDYLYESKPLELHEFELLTSTTLRIALGSAAFDPVLLLARVTPSANPADILVVESSLLVDDNGGGGI